MTSRYGRYTVDGNGGNIHHPGVVSNNMESNVVDSSSLPPECEDIHEREERDERDESTETNNVENVENVENWPNDVDNLEKEGRIALEPSQDSSSLPSDAVAARAGDDHEADPSAELPTNTSATPISASSANTTSVDQLRLPTPDNHVEGSVADNDAASSTALTTERVDDDEQRLKAELDRVNSRGSEGGRGGRGGRGDPITITTGNSNVKGAGDQGGRPSVTQLEPAKRSSDVRMQAFGDKIRAKLEEADSLKRKSSAGGAGTAQKISIIKRSSNGSVESLQAAASQRRSTARLSNLGSKLRAKLGQADSGGKNGIQKDATTTHLSRSSSVGSKNEQQRIQQKGSFNGSVAESLPAAASQRTSTLRLSNFDAKLKAKLEEADSVGKNRSENISTTTYPTPSTSVVNKIEQQRVNDAGLSNGSVSELLPAVASQRPSTARLSNFDDKLKAKLEEADSFGKNHIKYDSPKTARSTISSVGSSNFATATTSRNSMRSFASEASRSSSFIHETEDGNFDGIDVARASFEIRLRDKLGESRSSLAQNNDDHESRTMGALHPLPTGMRLTSFSGTTTGDEVAAEEHSEMQSEMIGSEIVEIPSRNKVCGPPMSTSEDGGCIGSSTPNPADDLHHVEGGISPTTDAVIDDDVHGALNAVEILPSVPGSFTSVQQEGMSAQTKHLSAKQIQSDPADCQHVVTAVPTISLLPERESLSVNPSNDGLGDDGGMLLESDGPHPTIEASVRRSSLHVVPGAFLVDAHTSSSEVIAAEPLPPWWRHRRVKILLFLVLALFVLLSIIVGVLASRNANGGEAPSSTGAIGVSGKRITNSTIPPSMSKVPSMMPTVSPTKCQSAILPNVQRLNFKGKKYPQIAIDGRNAAVIAFDTAISQLLISFFVLGEDGLWNLSDVLSEDTSCVQNPIKFSISVKGNLTLAGFPSFPTNAGDEAGVVIAYEQTNEFGKWKKVPEPIVPDDDGLEGALFGRSVQIADGLAAVGASGEDACYIFRRNETGWEQIDKITGWQCLLEDSSLVPMRDFLSLNVYLYNIERGISSLNQSSLHVNAAIQSAVATEEFVVLSTYHNGDNGDDPIFHGVSTYIRSDETQKFELMQFIDASKYSPGFGSTVSISGNLMAIGSSIDTYLFELRNDGTWDEVFSLDNSEIHPGIAKTGWLNMAISGRSVMASTIYEISFFELKSCGLSI